MALGGMGQLIEDVKRSRGVAKPDDDGEAADADDATPTAANAQHAMSDEARGAAAAAAAGLFPVEATPEASVADGADGLRQRYLRQELVQVRA
eukprot:7194378-Prymnesium_polylepis.1